MAVHNSFCTSFIAMSIGCEKYRVVVVVVVNGMSKSRE